MALLGPQYPVVHTNFKATDLLQGSLGDCWFISAVAVVAERPDLIDMVIPIYNVSNPNGIYDVRLFVDGYWQSFLLDSQFPTTEAGTLRFSACTRGQLWGPLIEKAYALINGSYHAVSGGQIEEAFLDLTGCPSEGWILMEDDFDMEVAWRRLKIFHELNLPIGCSTGVNSDLEACGLHATHAYSVLRVLEFHDPQLRALADGENSLRLVEIRNPLGARKQVKGKFAMGSENLKKVGEYLQEPIDQHTFWLEYTEFLQRFWGLSICKAHKNWFAETRTCTFPRRDSRIRCCPKSTFFLQGTSPTVLYVMTLQPTKRGSTHRTDRRSTYQYGDLVTIVFRIHRKTKELSVITAGFNGCNTRDSHVCVTLDDFDTWEYGVTAFCMGRGPTAASVDGRTDKSSTPPFYLRIFADNPVEIDDFPRPDQSAKILNSLFVEAPSIFARTPADLLTFDKLWSSRLPRFKHSIREFNEYLSLQWYSFGPHLFIVIHNSGVKVSVGFNFSTVGFQVRFPNNVVYKESTFYDASQANPFTHPQKGSGTQEFVIQNLVIGAGCRCLCVSAVAHGQEASFQPTRIRTTPTDLPMSQVLLIF